MSGRASRGARELAPRTEAEIQKAILAYLKLVPGVVAWKAGTGSFRATYKGRERFVRIGKVGVSDIIGWRSESVWTEEETPPPYVAYRLRRHWPRFLAIEVKNRRGVVTPEQRAFLDSVKAAGGIALIARSVADVQKELPTP